MTDIRALAADEWRAAFDLFLGTVHHAPVTDDVADQMLPGVEEGLLLGAFDAGELIGTADAMTSALRVPGGAMLAMAAVSDVGVRADRTRRGVLTALMRHQLTAHRDRGAVVASLRASQTAIYGRFGYGIATRVIELTVDTATAGLRNPGTVRVLGADERAKLLPELYRRYGQERTGAIERPDRWWRMFERPPEDGQISTAVLHGDGDGYAVYRVGHEDGARVSTVYDIWAATAQAYAGLWAYLLSVDLIPTVIVRRRPLDEPLDLLAADPRAVRITSSEDETWLRLLDVPAALAARSWGDGAVLIGVTDTVLADNGGCYRIGADGAERSSAEPELHCDVATLATLYLGDRTPTQLAFAGRLTGSAEALARADAVFATAEIPWCGTYF